MGLDALGQGHFPLGALTPVLQFPALPSTRPCVQGLWRFLSTRRAAQGGYFTFPDKLGDAISPPKRLG